MAHREFQPQEPAYAHPRRRPIVGRASSPRSAARTRPLSTLPARAARPGGKPVSPPPPPPPPDGEPLLATALPLEPIAAAPVAGEPIAAEPVAAEPSKAPAPHRPPRPPVRPRPAVAAPATPAPVVRTPDHPAPPTPLPTAVGGGELAAVAEAHPIPVLPVEEARAAAPVVDSPVAPAVEPIAAAQATPTEAVSVAYSPNPQPPNPQPPTPTPARTAQPRSQRACCRCWAGSPGWCWPGWAKGWWSRNTTELSLVLYLIGIAVFAVSAWPLVPLVLDLPADAGAAPAGRGWAAWFLGAPGDSPAPARRRWVWLLAGGGTILAVALGLVTAQLVRQKLDDPAAPWWWLASMVAIAATGLLVGRGQGWARALGPGCLAADAARGGFSWWSRCWRCWR